MSFPPGAAYGDDGPLPATPAGADPLMAVANMLHGRVERVAKRIGMPASTLQKKISLHNDTHHLSVSDLLMIQNATGDMAATQALAAAGGYICMPNHPHEAASVADGLARMMAEVGELARAVNEAGATGRGVTTHEEMRVLHCLAEALGAVNAAAASIRHVRSREGRA